ncbi:hypothetical protein [Clostridium oryzae]|uniref:Uncharacterized protein n=1 Tax=Clostridium oryzae TaxID=1450648 RepID=A0A1V4IEE3_9CLOT|nr:hypothetical protein [Clostridium oryzae]OPJ58341.1 hypothetical protein CLORY_36350 [Clostridium oryzae]
MLVIILSVILLAALNRSVKHGKRSFVKIRTKFMIRFGIGMIVFVAWIVLFYVFRLAVLVPYAARMSTYAILILAVTNIICGLFPKINFMELAANRKS